MPKTDPPASAPSAASTAIDAILMKGDFEPYWYCCLFVFCLSVALAVRKTNPKNFWHGAVASVMAGYGGGTISAMLLGRPGVLVAFEGAVPTMLCAWTLSGLAVVQALESSKVAVAALSTCFEMLRAQVAMGAFNGAHAVLSIPRYYPVPTVGPIVAALIGGVGGGFLPASKGLTPLEGGLNWRLRSAFFFAVWLQLTVKDPYAAPYVSAVGLGDGDAAKAAGVAVLAALPLVSLVFPGFQPLGVNPFVPSPPAPDAGAKKKKN